MQPLAGLLLDTSLRLDGCEMVQGTVEALTSFLPMALSQQCPLRHKFCTPRWGLE